MAIKLNAGEVIA